MKIGHAARRLLVVLGITALSLLCVTAPASALVTHLYLSSFELGPAGAPHSIAADSSTGDVYVYQGSSLTKYSSTGQQLEFSAAKSNYLQVGGGYFDTQVAVDNNNDASKGDIFVANEQAVLIFAPDGERVGQLSIRAPSRPPSVHRIVWHTQGVAIDSQGQVYVSLGSEESIGTSEGPGNGVIDKYRSKAPLVEDSDYESYVELFNPRWLAVDSTNNVYAGTGYNRVPVLKFAPLQFGMPGTTGSAVYAGDLNSIAIDGRDRLYLDEKTEVVITNTSGNIIERIRPAASKPYYFSGSDGLAVNNANGDVYVADNSKNRISVFSPAVLVPDVTATKPSATTSSVTLKGLVNPDGMQASCYFEYGTATSYGEKVPCASSPGSGATPVEVSAEIAGLKPSVLYHFRLVATNANGPNESEDETFALPYPPDVADEQAIGAELTTVDIRAAIDAMGFETVFHVEYGTNTNYGQITPAVDVPIGSSTEFRTADQLLTGLRPNTTYHYRVTATNANGTTYGTDETFTTFVVPPPETADTCPNSSFREGAGARLPDCRAYEMVSPVNKNGADIHADPRTIVVAPSGERIAFATHTGMANTHGSGDGGYTQYIATRGPGQWATNAIDPTPALTTPIQVFAAFTTVEAFSESMDSAVVRGYELPGGQGTPPGSENLYLENTATAHVAETISRFEGKVQEVNLLHWDPPLRGSSADLSVVTFESSANLVAPASGSTPKLYALDHGTVHLVGLLPTGGVPVGGSKAVRENEAVSSKDTVSRDGSRILFSAEAEGGGPSQIYMRKSESTTVLVSESESSEPEAPQTATFQGATPDGSKVLFTTSARLLDGDPGGAGEGLYMYTDGSDPTSESNLTFIARVRPVGHAQETVSAVSMDGTHVYFSSGSTAALPFQTSSGSALFLWDQGQIRQVAPAAGGESFKAGGQAMTTSDGRRIVFQNQRALTGAKIASLGPDSTELYLYDEASDSLKCVSCPPTGAAVTSGVETTVGINGVAVGFLIQVEPRFFSANGRYVFFNTSESLVPQDTNGVADAYEYDVETGKLSLLSLGTGELPVWFVSAGTDGRDVFLVTHAQLNAWDEDKLVDLYDARIDGGLPLPPVARIECAGDACQGVPSATPRFDVASEFRGRGNPVSEGPPAQPRSKVPTSAQRLRRALATCRHSKRIKPKHWTQAKLKRCEAAARRRYRAKAATKRRPHAGR